MKRLEDSGRKPLFPRGPGLGFRFFLLLLVGGGLLYADYVGLPQVQAARQWLAWALQPVTWISALPHALDDIGDNFESRHQLMTENQALKQRQLVLDAQLLRMRALEAENRRLRALLSSSTAIEHRVLVAEIDETSQDPYRHQILINKGSRDGVYRGQALVDAYGVLGQVIQVHRDDAVALLITDPDNGVPVEINRTGLQTVALGRGDGQTLSLPFLPGNADVHVGDLLVSSGLGGRFPAGYPVGRIRELKHPAGDSFMEAIADPAAHLNRSRQVLLVWSSAEVDSPIPKLPVDTRADDAADAPPNGRHTAASGTAGGSAHRAKGPPQPAAAKPHR